MLMSDGTLIKNDVIEAFNAAVENPENINSSGGINWDYVDADLFINTGFYSTDYLYKCFEVLVDEYYS